MKKWTFIAAALVFLTLSCTKEQRKSMLTKQETNIESFTRSILSKVDTAYAVQHRGVTRVVVVPGQGDSLDGGKASRRRSYFARSIHIGGCRVRRRGL